MTAQLLDPAKPIVSIVENDSQAQNHLARQIRKMRLESQCYASANAFLDSVDGRRHGCVIMDMSETRGLALLEALHGQNLELPVIGISAGPQFGERVALTTNRAFAMLEKPIEFVELRDSVRGALRADRLRRRRNQFSPPVPILIPSEAARIEESCEDFGLLPLQLLENSACVLCQFVLQRLPGNCPAPRVHVLAGKGRNGANAMAAARRMVNYGAKVTVFASHPITEMTPLAAIAARSAMRCGVPVLNVEPAKLSPPDLILDGLLGLGLRGAPYGQVAKLIHWANRMPCPKIACEAPSGLDADRGEPHSPTLRVGATLALGLPMRGVMASKAADFTGELFVGDIGVPLGVYRNLAIHAPPAMFSGGQCIRIKR